MKSPKRKEKLEKKSAKLLDRANRLTDEGKTVRAGIAAGRADKLTTKMYKKKGGITTTKMSKGGTLKEVPSDNKGLAKLPTSVRNNMGYKRAGGTAKKKK
jgi:hypothetical protein